LVHPNDPEQHIAGMEKGWMAGSSTRRRRRLELFECKIVKINSPT